MTAPLFYFLWTIISIVFNTLDLSLSIFLFIGRLKKKNRFYFLEQFQTQTHSKIELKVQKFFIYLLPPPLLILVHDKE